VRQVLGFLEAGQRAEQLTGRDRNRIALQSDLLGAAAMGIPTCCC
jgi:5,10-methylenetetrahydrofolate reductase